MNNSLIASGIITVIFAILSFVESKYISKTNKEVKETVRETVMVFASVFVGSLILDKLKLGKPNITSSKQAAAVFTDKPEF